MRKEQMCPSHNKSLDYSLGLNIKLGSVFSEGSECRKLLVRREDRD